MKQEPVPAALLRALLRYEPETGQLFWRPRSPEIAAASGCKDPGKAARIFNKQFAGREAFTATSHAGYKVGAIFDGGILYAHRVAWAIAHGEWPTEQIDHANGVRSDNREANLRQVSQSQNSQNSAKRRGAGSRFKGVSWSPAVGRWCMQISSGGRKSPPSFHGSEIEAAQAYDAAALELHGAFARTNRSLGILTGDVE